jgi:hypothetical protein
MKTCQLAKIQGIQVVELKKAFVAADKPHADALRLANAAVSASDGAAATGNVAEPDTSGDKMECTIMLCDITLPSSSNKDLTSYM